MKDPYEVLGVPRDADDKRIKDEYRKLARKHHPDVNPGDKKAEERFKDIQVAYDLLSDPAKRQEFDRGGPASFDLGGGGRGFGGRAGGGGHGFPSFEEIFGAGSLNDILSGLFGGGARGKPAGPVRGEDVQATIEVSLDEAMKGGDRELGLPLETPCSSCGGTGAAPGEPPRACPGCSGSGQQTMSQGSLRFATTCAQCGGRGKLQSPCPSCQGTRIRTETRRVRVRIPAGVADGALLRVPGQGMPSGGGPGDLFLRVQLLTDPRFERRGQDLYVELPITIPEAGLGGDVQVTTPDGPVRVRVPAGTPSGRKLRLTGRGVPSPRGVRGDLYAEVKVVPPPEPTEEERALLEQFARVSRFDPRAS